MSKLNNSSVRRAGVTAPYWNHGTSNISAKGNNKLEFDFKLASKGGGTTMVQVQIAPDDFEAVIEEMMKCDQARALKVMSEAIAVHHA